MTDEIALDLPSYDELWDYADPQATERVFRELEALYPQNEAQSWRLELRTQIARTLGLQRRFDEAHALLDEVDESLPPSDSIAGLRSSLERGRLHRSTGNISASIPLFEKAWHTAQKLDHDPLAVDAAHMLAIVVEGEDGLGWHERARSLATTSSDPGANRWLASLANNLGWTYHGLKRFEDALDCFEQALTLREEKGDPEAIRVARWCIGRCLRSMDRLPGALAVQRRLLDEYTEAGEESGYVHEELGELLLVTDAAEEARPHFKKASQILSKDEWLQETDADRLARLERLGG